MNLEDIRGAKVGDIVLQFPFQQTSVLFAASFHRHAQQANAQTLDELRRLAGIPVHGTADSVSAALEWWRTIESLVACLFTVAQIEAAANMRPTMGSLTNQKDPPFMTKWGCVLRWFSNGQRSAPSDLNQRLTELREFRNSAEHSSRQHSIQVKRSRLGTVPSEANLSDAMEALAICIEACSLVRQVLPGLDLMPVVSVPSSNHSFFLDLDEIARDLYFPQFRAVLSNLGLTSNVALYPSVQPLAGSALIAPRLLQKAVADLHDPKPKQALRIDQSFETYASRHKQCPGPDSFKLPGYKR